MAVGSEQSVNKRQLKVPSLPSFKKVSPLMSSGQTKFKAVFFSSGTQ